MFFYVFAVSLFETPQLNPFRAETQTTRKLKIRNLVTHLNLSRNLRLRVGDLDAQLLCSRNDVDSLSGGDVVGNPVGVWLAIVKTQ